MVPILLLLCAAGHMWAEAMDCSKIPGSRQTLLVASNDVEMTEENGPMRPYMRHIDSSEDCRTISFRFFTKANGVCKEIITNGTRNEDGVYIIPNIEETYFTIDFYNDEALITYTTMKGDNPTTAHMMAIYGKRKLPREEHQNIVRLAKGYEILEENIQYVTEADTCPE